MADQSIGAPTYNVPYSSISRDIEQGGENIVAVTKGLSVIADTTAQISGERKADAFEEGLEHIGNAAVVEALSEAAQLRDLSVFNENEQDILANIDMLYERATYTTGTKKAAVQLQAKRMIQDFYANTGSQNVKALLHGKYQEFFSLHPSMDMLDALDTSRQADQSFAQKQLEMIQDKSYNTYEQGGYEIPQHFAFLGSQWRSAYLGASALEQEAQSLELATQEGLAKSLTGKENFTMTDLVDLSDSIMLQLSPRLIDPHVWDTTNFKDVPVRVRGAAGTLHELFFRADALRKEYSDILIDKTGKPADNNDYIREYEKLDRDVKQFFANRAVQVAQLKTLWNSYSTGPYKGTAETYLNTESGKIKVYEDILTNYKDGLLKLDAKLSPLVAFEAANKLWGEQVAFEAPKLRAVLHLVEQMTPLLEKGDPWVSHMLQRVLQQTGLAEMGKLIGVDSQGRPLDTVVEDVGRGSSITGTDLAGLTSSADDMTRGVTPNNTNLPPDKQYQKWVEGLVTTGLIQEVTETPVFTQSNQSYPVELVAAIKNEAAWLIATSNSGASSFDDGRAGIESRYIEPEFVEMVALYMDKGAGKTTDASQSFQLLGHAVDTYYTANNYAAKLKEALYNYTRAPSWQGLPLLDLVDIDLKGLEEGGDILITAKPDAAQILALADPRIGEVGDYSASGESLEGVPLEGRGLWFSDIPEEIFYMQDPLTGLVPPVNPSRDPFKDYFKRTRDDHREIYGTESLGEEPRLSEADYSIMLERLEYIAPILAEKLTTWAKLDALRYMLNSGTRANTLEVLSGHPDPTMRRIFGATQ